MVIRVTGNVTGASVSTVKPRASVVVVDPVASVSYTVPVAAVAYVELNVAAYLDTTGRFKYTTDSVVLADGTAFLLSRPVADAVGTDDDRTFNVSKGLSETAVLSDTVVTVLVFIRQFVESLALSDAQALQVAKALTEAVASSDAYTLTVSPRYSDAATVLDAATLSLAKAFVEAASATDASVLDVAKILAEVTSLADTAIISVGKAVDDAQLVDDNLNRSTDKALSDGFGLNEQVRFDYSLASTIDNVTFAGDLATFATAKANSETITLADSGSIRAQGYCDLTYFAEDYVGIATVF
jgi:hypothetical protein